jgi:large subunit ribosomal protein L6
MVSEVKKMSRVGRTIIKIPAGVKVSEVVENGVRTLSVAGPKGTLTQEIKQILVEIAETQVELKRSDDQPATRSLHGLYNRLIQNMVKGVTEGFSRFLLCNGVGYKAAVKGDGGMTLSLGMSHPVDVPAVKGITFGVLTPQEIQALGFGKVTATVILRVSGICKETVGAVASKIRAARPVEPYHFYGIRYSDEYVQKKESKSGAKKK